jgi:hypothetical protein
MADREFQREEGAGTGMVLRLTRPWWMTGRVVLADSAFASVKTAVSLLERGLYFLGIVKTEHKEFPKKYFAQVETSKVLQRGEHVALTTVINNSPIYAVSWSDRKRKDIVATCGTTVPASPHRKKRWITHDDGRYETYYKEVDRCHIVQEYFGGAQKIDVHNHLRQSGLNLESIRTQSWYTRFFCTWLGMIEVDAFLAYQRFTFGHEAVTHKDFVKELADALLNNTIGVANNRVLRHRDVAAPEDEGETCVIKSLVNHVRFAGKKQGKRNCFVCNVQSYYYCVPCSDRAGTIIAICGLRTGRTCMSDHEPVQVDE